MTVSPIFAQCFAVVVGLEGGYDNSSYDPGNWTSGRVGSGILKGTAWGISAASYPQLNIKSLTQADAQEIYLRDYWTPAHCDVMPTGLALMVFDSAVNNGVHRAIVFLQTMLRVTADGVMGPQTLAAVASIPDVDAACIEFLAQRLRFMASLPTWEAFSLGWSRRLCALPFKVSALLR